MYEYLIGKVTGISSSFIILEVNNIGYKIFILNNENIKLNYFTKLYIYYHFNESLKELYGFTDKMEKEVFLKLLEVKKIGVKTAFMILKKIYYQDLLRYINENDEETLLKVPKITKENLQILIQKLSCIEYRFNLNINLEFLAILRSLEYQDKEIFNVYKKINKNQEINFQIKDAIKLLEESQNE